jgi:hypothetical protein
LFYNLKFLVLRKRTYITSGLFTHNKAIEISVFVSVGISDVDFFLWVYYCKTYSLTVIEPFSMVRLFRASSYSKYTNYRLFDCSCLVVTMCPSRRSLTSWLSRFKLSPTTQFPRFVFERFRQLRLLNRISFSSTTVKQIPLCSFGLLKFSCNWRVYCNVNIFVVLISWMVPRVSMIPVNISYFILLNLHFKISNKYTS